MITIVFSSHFSQS